MNYLFLILSVLCSFGFIVLTRPKKKVGLQLLLAFSGAFLLAITIFELLPEVYQATDTKTIGVFIMLGILLQIFLEFFSKGAEHGHIHLEVQNKQFPWLLFISLCIHALLEGIPVHDNNPILFGILVHKIPIALILSIFLLTSKIATYKAILFITLFSLMTPLGSLVAENLEFVLHYKTPITALVIGVFFHISTVILFESSQGHTFNLRKLLVIILGITFAYFI